MNFTMLHELEAGRAVDPGAAPRLGDDFILGRLTPGLDYCVFDTGDWIWSIGRRKRDGLLLASTSMKFHHDPAFECVWAR